MVEKKYLLVGAAAAGLVLAYMVYRGAGAVGGAVVDAAKAVNPLNNDNVINRGFTSVYQALPAAPAAWEPTCTTWCIAAYSIRPAVTITSISGSHRCIRA